MALVHAELTATCNSLGYAGPEKYCIDPQCSGIYLRFCYKCYNL